MKEMDQSRITHTQLKEALIEALLSPLAVGKIRQRQIIQQLLPEIAALRSMDVDYDEIATILRDKGMRLTGETLRGYYFEEKATVNANNAAEEAARYKRIADQVLDKMAATTGRNVEAALERALSQSSRLARAQEKTRAGAGPSNASGVAAAEQVEDSGGEKSQQQHAATAKREEKSDENKGNKNGAKNSMRQRPPSESGDNKPTMTLEEVQKMLGEHIDLSTIPRRPYPPKDK